MKSPLVSIIIPTYNRAHLIGETLDSVLAQTYTYWECIVVDDGSKDETETLLKRYCEKDSRFQYYQRPNNRLKGANACRNYGFELSKGEYVNWFDDDDVMHHNKLLIQVNALVNNNFNFSVCQTLVFENTIDMIAGLRSKSIYSDDILYDYLSQKIMWLTQAPLWKKSFLQTFDYLFDEELQAAQEWKFHCRVLACCKEYDVINEPLVYIRQHNESVTSNSNVGNRIWHYFLSRNKLYKNDNIKLNKQGSEYLQNYLLKNFKNYVRSYCLKESLKSFYLYVLSEKEFNGMVKFYAGIEMISYFITHKGNLFLKKVTYTR